MSCVEALSTNPRCRQLAESKPGKISTTQSLPQQAEVSLGLQYPRREPHDDLT